MRTLLRIGTGLAAAMAIAFALVWFVTAQRQRVLADDPPHDRTVRLTDARTDIPLRPHADVTQIVLKTKIIEIDRQKLAEMGIGLPELVRSNGDEARQTNTARNALQFESFKGREADLFIKLLRTNGVAKILAEPTLIGVEGHPVSFHSGGEFPVVQPQAQGTVAIEFRKFGTEIYFTGKRQASGRLRLEIRVGQSELDNSRSVNVNGTQVPGLKSRWVDTAIEMLPGHTVAFYGEQGDHLLIMVTPEIVEPLEAKQQDLARQPLPNPSTPFPRPPRAASQIAAPPAPVAPPVPLDTERAKVAMTALIYKVDSASLREDGIELGKMLSMPPENAYAKRSAESVIDARKLASLMRTLSETKGVEVLSRPQVLTLSGEPAQLQVGSRVRLQTSGRTQRVSDEYRDVGFKIDLVPIVLDQGRIQLEARVEHSRVTDDKKSILTSTLSEQAELYTGETLAVYEEGNDLLMLVTPRLVADDLASTPSPLRQRTPDLDASPLPQAPRGKAAIAGVAADESQTAAKEEGNGKLPELAKNDAPAQPVIAEVNPLSPQRAKPVGGERELKARAVKEFEQVTQELFPDATIKLHSLADGVVISGDVAEVEQLSVLAAIAEELFPSVICNVRVAEPSSQRPAAAATQLQDVLAELFPDQEIKVRPLNNSVVLKGTVDRQSVEQILRIAEDYYPNVIDHLRKIGDPPADVYAAPALPVKQAQPKPTPISDELQQLRVDVQSLRQDVKRLIEIMEQRPADPDGDAEPTPEAQSSAPAPLLRPNFDNWESTAWRLSLSEARKIAFANFKAFAVAEASPSGLTLSSRNDDLSPLDFEIGARDQIGVIESAYWNLWVAHRDLDARRRAKDAAHALGQQVYELKQAKRGSAQSEVQSREHYNHCLTLVGQSFAKVVELEGILRQALGFEATDGRIIHPSDDPPTKKVTCDLNEALEDALANSPELRRQQKAIRQAELDFKAARNLLTPGSRAAAMYRWEGNPDLADLDSVVGQGGVNVDGDQLGLEFSLPVGYRRELVRTRNAALILARERAREQEVSSNLSRRLTSAFQELDASQQLMEGAINRSSESKSEVESVTALHSAGKATLDLLIDAQRRCTQDEADYHSAAGRYAIALTNVRSLSGTLLEQRGVAIVDAETMAPTQPYTIYVEPIVLKPLRDGCALHRNFDEKERDVRRIRVVVGSDSQSLQPGKRTIISELQQGWRPNEEGGLDLLLQLSHQQFEAFAAGAVVDCHVDPEVTSFRNLYVFAGDTQLPRELPE